MSEQPTKRLKWIASIGGAAALILLMLYMTGFFIPVKIGPGTAVPPPRNAFEPAAVATAERKDITEFYEAVGTIRPVVEIQVEALVRARIREVSVRPGDHVKKGATLILLESSEMETQVEQAQQAFEVARANVSRSRQGLKAAEAAYEQAEAHYRRIETYFASEAATEQDLEQARSMFLQARASREGAADALLGAESAAKQAKKAVRAAEIHFGYTRVTAPEEGQVSNRLAEPGDLAFPGKPLLLLQTPDRLRLEAQVREGLMQRVAVGQRMPCIISALERKHEVVIQEIVPAADPATRTFLVKASLPRDPELLPGMFGRLLVPVKERPAVLVPKTALREVGQLSTVMAKIDGTWQEIFVRTGQSVGDRVEILSGLGGGEVLSLRGKRQ